MQIYNIISENKNWEIIWVSEDHNEDESNDYFKEMPWIRLQWSEKATRGKSLFKLSKQQYIPAVTMVDPQFNVINKECHDLITFEPEDFPWAS